MPVRSPPVTVHVPWDVPVIAQPNGRHPLPSSLLVDDADCVFRHDLVAADAAARARVQAASTRLSAALAGLGAGLTAEHIAGFIASRDPDSQALMDPRADLLFLHTSPFTLDDRPWLLHVEVALTLFEPEFGHFRTWDIDLDRQPAYHAVRHLLRSPMCRGIYTHIERTRDDLPALFRDPALAEKMVWAPLGLELPADVVRRVPDAVARRDARGDDDEVVFLYTNSWHQHPASFFVRGGHDLLWAFGELSRRHPQRRCRLIVRSALPDALGPDLLGAIRNHPQITLIDMPIADEALYDLLLTADVFVLPSANLHSISILRAMATGAVVLASDAFAVEEFIRDGETGVVARGRAGTTYREDRAAGLLRERSGPIFEAGGGFRQSLLDGMESLLLRRDRRATLRHAALAQVERRHALGPWRERFRTLVMRAAGRG